MLEEHLASLLADPDDLSRRLVFADWLVEQGDPRGEWIHLRVATENGRCPPETATRLKALERTFAKPTERRVRKLGLSSIGWRGGFIASGKIRGRAFVENAVELFAAAPLLTELRFEYARRVWPRLVATPELGRLSRIDLTGERTTPEDLRRLDSDGHVGRLRALVLEDTKLEIDGMSELLSTRLAGRLTHLNLNGNNLGGHGLAILRDHLPPELRSLEVRDVSAEPDEVEAFVRAVASPDLDVRPNLAEAIALGACPITRSIRVDDDLERKADAYERVLERLQRASEVDDDGRATRRCIGCSLGRFTDVLDPSAQADLMRRTLAKLTQSWGPDGDLDHLRDIGHLRINLARLIEDPERAEALDGAEFCFRIHCGKVKDDAYNIACVRALAGDLEGCRKWLLKARQATNQLPSADHLRSDEDMDPVRNEPWFEEFVNSIP